MFGTVSKAVSGTKELINFARDLRKSGSDIVVEEDLAEVFGRGKIVSELEVQFKKNILGNIKSIPLHPSSEIHLHAGPGPTVNRALKDKDRRYLSTVIQLSLLVWVHDCDELASSLAECMARRFQLGVAGATPPPDFEGISGTLRACSSQATSFNWAPILEQTRAKIRQHFQHHLFPTRASHGDAGTLYSTTLLAAMDYLYLVQSLPEDRKMILKSSAGMIPLIVWAHNVLGLTVLVCHPKERTLQFGVGESQVIIHLAERDKENQDILLLDRNEEIVLKSMSDSVQTTRIESKERHYLQGFGTQLLRRNLNRYITTLQGNTLFQVAAQFIIAFVIKNSRSMRRTADLLSDHREEDNRDCVYLLELWRIYDAADVIFYGISYDKKETDTYVSMFKTSDLWDTALPDAINMYCEECEGVVWKMYGPEETDRQGIRREFLNCVATLNVFLFAFSHVIELRDCSDLPLVLDSFPSDHREETLSDHINEEGSISLHEDTLFDHIGQWLVGSPFLMQHRFDMLDETFLISEAGWSVFLNNIQDGDPAKGAPELLHVKRGIPTNTRTNEQKHRIGDSLSRLYPQPATRVEDRGDSYIPRCVIGAASREEYCTSRSDAFQLSIQYKLDLPSNLGQDRYEIMTGYRTLHKSLWNVRVTKACPHYRSSLKHAKLGFGVVAAAGFSLKDESLTSKIPEKICIVLVKEDQHARWLAVWDAGRSGTRRVMLRSDDCCENCALDAVIPQSGKWVLII